MWTRCVALVVVLGLLPATARAEAPAPRTERGFLTGLGFSLLVVGLGGAGLGVAGLTNRLDTTRLLARFPSPPSTTDVPTILQLEERLAMTTPLLAVGFVTAGVGLLGAILCLVLDAPKAPVQVSVMPTLQGGAFSLDVRF